MDRFLSSMQDDASGSDEMAVSAKARASVSTSPALGPCGTWSSDARGTATQVIRSFLYDVSPTDPLTFRCVAVILVGVALLASYGRPGGPHGLIR